MKRLMLLAVALALMAGFATHKMEVKKETISTSHITDVATADMPPIALERAPAVIQAHVIEVRQIASVNTSRGVASPATEAIDLTSYTHSASRAHSTADVSEVTMSPQDRGAAPNTAPPAEEPTRGFLVSSQHT